VERSNFRILIVDDEKSFTLLLSRILQDAHYTVKGITDPREALSIVDSFHPHLVITDLKMPAMDGISLMEQVRAKQPETDFIMITAFGTVEAAVDVMKRGALDFVSKPLKDPDQLRIAVSKAFERQGLLRENELLKSETLEGIPPFDVLFDGMEQVLREIGDVAPTDATVMLYGETGTGKSLLAKVIHHLSGRKGPFVDINCAAIPENLLESELFGYERGAFTGATSPKPGRFELASDGTLFLDEVSEMSSTLQVKLLKVLQEKTFERLGSLNTIRTNARVVAATNRELKQLVDIKKFREDLFYRLNVFPVTVPPLRQRKEAIPAIASYLIRSLSARLGKAPLPLREDTHQSLLSYSWPGNVRELENVLERALIVSRGDYLSIPPLLESQPAPDEADTEGGDLKSLERAAIERALAKTGGHRKKAADLLGISLRSLHYKIKEYGITD